MPAPSSVQSVSYVLIPNTPSEVSATLNFEVVDVAVVNLSNVQASDVQVKHSPATPSISVDNAPNPVGDSSVLKFIEEVGTVEVEHNPKAPASIEPHHLNPVLSISSGHSPYSISEFEVLYSPSTPDLITTDLYKPEPPVEVGVASIGGVSEVSVLTTPNTPLNVSIPTEPNAVSTVQAWDGRYIPSPPSFFLVESTPIRPRIVGYNPQAEAITRVTVRVFYTIPNEVLSVTPELVVLSPNQPATVNAIVASEPGTLPAEPLVLTATLQGEHPETPSSLVVSHDPNPVGSLGINVGSRSPASVSVNSSPHSISYIFAGTSAPSECSDISVEHSPNKVTEVSTISGNAPSQVQEVFTMNLTAGWVPDPDFNFPSEFDPSYDAHTIIFLQPYSSGWGDGKIYYPGDVWITTGKAGDNSSIRAEDPENPRDKPYDITSENRNSGNWNWIPLSKRGIIWEFAKVGNLVTPDNTIFVEAHSDYIAGYDPTNYVEEDFHIRVEDPNNPEANGYYMYTGSVSGVIWRRIANLDFTPSESDFAWVQTTSYGSDTVWSKYLLTYDLRWAFTEGLPDSVVDWITAYNANDVDNWQFADPKRYIKITLAKDYFNDGTYSEKQLMLAEELPAATSYPVVGSIIREYEVTGSWGDSSDFTRRTGPVLGYRKILGGEGDNQGIFANDWNNFVTNSTDTTVKNAYENNSYSIPDYYLYDGSDTINAITLEKNWASLLSDHEAMHPGLVSNVLLELDTSDGSNFINTNNPQEPSYPSSDHTAFEIYWALYGRDNHYPAYASSYNLGSSVFNSYILGGAQGIHWEIIDPSSIQDRPEKPNSVSVIAPPLQPSIVGINANPLEPSVVSTLTNTKSPLSVEVSITASSPANVEVSQYLALEYFPDTQLDYFDNVTGDVTIDSNGHLVLGPSSSVNIDFNWHYLRTYDVRVKLEGFDISGGFSGMTFPDSSMGNNFGFSIYSPAGYKNVSMQPNTTSTSPFQITTGGSSSDGGTLKISEINILIKKMPPETPDEPVITAKYDRPVSMLMRDNSFNIPADSAAYIKFENGDRYWYETNSSGSLIKDEFPLWITPGTKVYIGSIVSGLTPWDDANFGIGSSDPQPVWTDINQHFDGWEKLNDSLSQASLVSELSSTFNFWGVAGDPTFYSFIMPQHVPTGSSHLKFRARITPSP